MKCDRWQTMALGNFVTLQRGHDLPEGERRVGTVPVMGSAGITGYHDSAKAKGPGVTIGRSGVGSMGVVSFSPVDYWPHNTTLYVTDFHGNNERFTYYFLKSLNLRRFDSGSAQCSLNRNYLYPIAIRVPPVADQEAIAEILATLDDKIELSRRTNETLEGMARAIFKSWFVDFDPVRAKAAGRQPAGMDAATAALFPDGFQDSPLGKIPKGWRVGTLADIADVVMGTSPPGDTYNEDGLGTPLVNGPVEFGDRFPVRKKWTTAPARLSKEGDLIFCVRGSTTGRRVMSDGVYCLGRGVCAIRSPNGCQPFVNQTVDVGLEVLLSRITGSVFPNLNAPDIKGFKVLLPAEAAVRSYCAVAEPVAEAIKRDCQQATALAAIRDALLPRLLSGDIATTAAETTLAEATRCR